MQFSRPQVVLQCFYIAWMCKGILWHAQHATKTWRHFGSTLVELAQIQSFLEMLKFSNFSCLKDFF